MLLSFPIKFSNGIKIRRNTIILKASKNHTKKEKGSIKMTCKLTVRGNDCCENSKHNKMIIEDD